MKIRYPHTPSSSSISTSTPFSLIRASLTPPPPSSSSSSGNSISSSSSKRSSVYINPNKLKHHLKQSQQHLQQQQEVQDPDQALLSLLRQRKTEEAWLLYSESYSSATTEVTESSHLPSSTCLSRLVCQLSYKNTQEAFSRAQSIITRLRHAGQLHRLDANSLGLLAVSATRLGHTPYAISIIKSMLRSNYLPHVKAWSAVVSKLAGSGDDGPLEAIRLFEAVCKRIDRVQESALVEQCKPDTGAFNAVLNACANVGDVVKFGRLFDQMSDFGAVPDALTYNVMIKLCSRVEREDLLARILELMLRKDVEPCITTLHSLVAAYVGFGDLDTAEQLIQALREGRRDLCRILRDANMWNYRDDEDEKREADSQNDEVLEKMLNDHISNDLEPPLLPKSYSPSSRMYTTLMKGYMKAGRVAETVQMLEAMRCQEDKNSHPDSVSYTTVISAFVQEGSMDSARQVLAEMNRIGVPANCRTYNILLKGYCQQLQIGKVKELLSDMTAVGILPDVVSYNTVIDGCILVDDSAGALDYFNKMREQGIAPTKVSYTTLMKAFANSGQPKLANKVFDEMLRDPRVKADLVAWNMLVEAYCKMGLIEEAKKVVERMREQGIHPNVCTYGSLANGIALARRPGEVLLLWNELKERMAPRTEEEKLNSSLPPPIKPDEGLLDSLADICVRAAFFKKALEIVACMEENGIPPNRTKFTRIYVEMHSRMFTSKHASQARQDRRRERKRAAEAFKFWLGLPNEYYSEDWRNFEDSSY